MYGILKILSDIFNDAQLFYPNSSTQREIDS